MGIRHVGLVTGTGRFTLRRAAPRPHPVHVGGAAAPVVDGLAPWAGGRRLHKCLRRVWRRNLANLKRQVEAA